MSLADTGGFDLVVEIGTEGIKELLRRPLGDMTGFPIAVDGIAVGNGIGIRGDIVFYLDDMSVSFSAPDHIHVVCPISPGSYFKVSEASAVPGEVIDLSTASEYDRIIPIGGEIVLSGKVKDNTFIRFQHNPPDTMINVIFDPILPSQNIVLSLVRAALGLQSINEAAADAIYRNIFADWAYAIRYRLMSTQELTTNRVSVSVDALGFPFAPVVREMFLSPTVLQICSKFAPPTGRPLRQPLNTHIRTQPPPGSQRGDLSALVVDGRFFSSEILATAIATRFPRMRRLRTTSSGDTQPASCLFTGSVPLPVTMTDNNVPMTAKLNALSAFVGSTVEDDVLNEISSSIVLFAHMSGTVGTLGTTFECAFDIVLTAGVISTGTGIAIGFTTVPGTPRRSEWRQTVPFGLALASLGTGLFVYDAPDTAALAALRGMVNGMSCNIISTIPGGIGRISVLPETIGSDPKTLIVTSGLQPATTVITTNPFPIQDILLR